MTISVVIPAYNEEKYIADCIESVLSHAPENLVDIIVVCNACTDRTAEVALRYPQVRVVQEPRKGTGYARHKGFELSRGELVAYLDADTRIHDDWFPRIEREFASDRKLVSLSGPYKFYDLPEWKSKVVFMWWMACAMPEYHRCKFAILGGNFAVRRSALEAVGGFDTSIPFWGDDTNLARRLHAVGTVKFTMDFYNYSSARRLQGQGFVKAGTYYAINYLSQAYLQRTFMLGYGERPWETAPARAVVAGPAARRLPTMAQATRYVRSYVRPYVRRDDRA